MTSKLMSGLVYHGTWDVSQPASTVESAILDVLDVVTKRHDDYALERPRIRQKLENGTRLCPSMKSSNDVLLCHTTIVVQTNLEANTKVLDILSLNDEPLPFNLSFTSGDGTFSTSRRPADPDSCSKLILLDLCHKRRILGPIYLHDLDDDALKVFRLIRGIQPNLKTVNHYGYHHFVDWHQDLPAYSHICFASAAEKTEIVLHFKVFWRDGQTCLDHGRHKSSFLDLFNAVLHSSTDPWSSHDFFDSVFIPPSDYHLWPQVQNPILNSPLYPFQKRTLQYMLKREGVILDNHCIVSGSPPRWNENDSSLSYQPFCSALLVDISEVQGLVSPALGTIYHKDSHPQSAQPIRGGLLAEEMGLGKTVEMIALMLLHPRTLCTTRESPMVHDSYSNKMVISSSATLIITPIHLLQQWQDELARHAPHLKMHFYGGTKASLQAAELAEMDVVITTYAILAREIWYANAVPARNFRHAKRFKPLASKLVEISWWRVCLDEAQMVENGLTNSAIVARLIPRINAWAISGTPFKRHVTDLLGILTFLRLEPFCNPRIWKRLDKSTFSQLMGNIAIRHTKDKIRHELRLPGQKRVVVTIPFTPIEEQNYTQVFEMMCCDTGLEPNGSPTTNDFDPDTNSTIHKMRTWLRRLRQLCLYPQVGQVNKRAFGLGRDGPLRTIEEVLQMMINQNEAQTHTLERVIIENEIKIGHIRAFDQSNPKRAQHSLDHYSKALDMTTPIVQQNQEMMDAKSLDTAFATSSAPNGLDPFIEQDENNEKAREEQKTATDLRRSLKLLHMCHFFIATTNYQMKEDEKLTGKATDRFRELESLETHHYQLAKQARLSLLKYPREKAKSSMLKVEKLAWKLFKTIVMPEYQSGIENVNIMEKYSILVKLLNQQTAKINQTRDRVRQILLQPLLDNDDVEGTGNEYEGTTKQQEELVVLFLVLRTFVANRTTMLTGETNFLAEHEAEFALKAAKSDDPKSYRGPAPELLIELLGDWSDCQPESLPGSFRGIISELRTLLSELEVSLVSRAMIEASIVEGQLKKVQEVLTLQLKSLQEMEKEIGLQRTCMNDRIAYYRELQQVSDMVEPFKATMDESLDSVQLERIELDQNRAEAALARCKTKQRFLKHLKSESDTGHEEPRICVICQSIFENGVLTICGHQYCRECIREWFNQHRTCPICKVRLTTVDLHDITYKPREITASEEHQATDSPSGHGQISKMDKGVAGSASPPPTRTTIYSAIDISTLNQIKSINLGASFGTKIDSLSRHLIWLRDNDPRCKSIIFSQFTGFLGILASAFEKFQIGFSKRTDRNGIDRFCHDARVECFLLDAKSDNSGLNLTNATHVFLCEPFVNPAIELQAIARVHRIGQTRPTTVWMMLIADSVEQAVYTLSVNRRLEHMAEQQQQQKQKDAEHALDAANSAELQNASLSVLLPKASGKQDANDGEIVQREDLWTCLFTNSLGGRGRLDGRFHEELARESRANAAERRMSAADLEN